MVDVYTDGSSINNPGPSGWSFLVKPDSVSKNEGKTCTGNSVMKNIISKSGGCAHSTNSRMEIIAVIEALKHFEETKSTITINTDSLYVLNCAQGKWKRNKNLDLWELYDKVAGNKRVKWKWVKGHSGDKYNTMVDKMARNEAMRQ